MASVMPTEPLYPGYLDLIISGNVDLSPLAGVIAVFGSVGRFSTFRGCTNADILQPAALR